ncbi:MAG: hypothetical protein AAF703_11975, partial [Cyanobacteria bacterium P01_D01_bin.105]
PMTDWKITCRGRHHFAAEADIILLPKQTSFAAEANIISLPKQTSFCSYERRSACSNCNVVFSILIALYTLYTNSF